MQSDWILDVLADLRSFALSNDLPALAEQLDDTAIVALAEITALNEGRERKPVGGVEQKRIRKHSGNTGAIGLA